MSDILKQVAEKPKKQDLEKALSDVNDVIQVTRLLIKQGRPMQKELADYEALQRILTSALSNLG